MHPGRHAHTPRHTADHFILNKIVIIKNQYKWTATSSRDAFEQAQPTEYIWNTKYTVVETGTREVREGMSHDRREDTEGVSCGWQIVSPYNTAPARSVYLTFGHYYLLQVVLNTY